MGNITGSSTSSVRGNGIIDFGLINSAGTILGTATGRGGPAIYNLGVINNEGAMTGGGSAVFGGIANYGSINNDGAVTGTDSNRSALSINNGGSINNYCGVALRYSLYKGTPPNAVSCYTATFAQGGLPSGAAWGVSASWGPFIIPVRHSGTGASIPVDLNGTLEYYYDTSVTSSGRSYYCSSGCQGFDPTPGNVSISATYSPETITTVTNTFTSTQIVTFTPTSGSIRVSVYDSGGKPVANAPVTLGGPSGKTLDTDSSGQASFSGLALGRSYNVSATVDGAKLWAPVSLSATDDQAAVVLESTPPGGASALEWGAVVVAAVAAVGGGAYLLLKRRPQ